jgi:hypothetical protein
MCDVAAFSVDMIGAIACVANNLRYEWEHYTGVFGPDEWTYNFVSGWPNSGTPMHRGFKR